MRIGWRGSCGSYGEVEEMFEDGKVTVAYMKSFEIEQMWINKGIEQGISQ